MHYTKASYLEHTAIYYDPHNLSPKDNVPAVKMCGWVYAVMERVGFR